MLCLKSVEVYGPNYGLKTCKVTESRLFSQKKAKSLQSGKRSLEIPICPRQCPGHLVFYQSLVIKAIVGDTNFEEVNRSNWTYQGANHQSFIKKNKNRSWLTLPDWKQCFFLRSWTIYDSLLLRKPPTPCVGKSVCIVENQINYPKWDLYPRRPSSQGIGNNLGLQRRHLVRPLISILKISCSFWLFDGFLLKNFKFQRNRETIGSLADVSFLWSFAVDLILSNRREVSILAGSGFPIFHVD